MEIPDLRGSYLLFVHLLFDIGNYMSYVVGIMNVTGDFVLKPTPLTKDQACAARRMWARWNAHTTGNTYVLYVRSRTCNHTFRVVGHGKNPWQAVLRYYKGIANNAGTWIWTCTKVVAVYTCACSRTYQAGNLLLGQAQ